MPYIIVHQNGITIVNSSDVGKFSLENTKIYYTDKDVVGYSNNKFISSDNEQLDDSELIDVTEQYIDISEYVNDIYIKETLELQLPEGIYDVYLENKIIGQFESNGTDKKMLKPNVVGRYKIVARDKPCNGGVFRVYEPAIEII